MRDDQDLSTGMLWAGGPKVGSLRTLLKAQEEKLQLADSVDAVVAIVRQTLANSAGVGSGALYLLVERGELERVTPLEGARRDPAPASDLELTGMARRAMREGEVVRQVGDDGEVLWAAPLRSAFGFEGAIVATGDPDYLGRFLAHAGHALARERRRAGIRAREAASESRADLLERAVDVLDKIAREGGSGTVLHHIAGAARGVCGIGSAALWSLRAEDGVYVEIARAANGEVELPAAARRTASFETWLAALPRWNGVPWLAAQRGASSPGPRDALIVELVAPDAPHPIGFLVAGVEESLGDETIAESLVRWASLARLALEQRVTQNENRRALETLREETEQAAALHRLKTQFIAAVSHELRTPLTSISAYAETLRTAADPDEETKERFLRVIHEESQRLARIVDEILDLATLDSGRVRLVYRCVSLTEVVEDALDVMRPIAKEKDIRLGFSAGPEGQDAHEVDADRDLLKQLLVNLVENAVKFSPVGSAVSIGLESGPSAVRLVVSDRGPGIPADKLDAVFERFFQVDATDARGHGGAGLGLAICKSIVTWHDGRIWAESGEGEGTRFVVSLPRARATSHARISVVNGDESLGQSRIPELLTEMVAEVMNSDLVSLMLLDPKGDELFVQAALGLPDEAIRDARVKIGERISGVVAETGETLFVEDLAEDDRFATSSPEHYRSQSLLSVPIRLREVTIGVLNVTNKASGTSFTVHDRRLVEMLAERVALILQKLRDYGESREQLGGMESAIRSVIDVRRHYYRGGESYSDLVLAVCGDLNIDPERTARIHYASLLRDVGMSRLPEGVYKKPTPLSPEDREVIRSHPEEGARVLRPIEFLPDVFDMILAHHEEVAGTGYPRGLSGSEIPLGAKILSVVDAYHALSSGRPYRSAVGAPEAVDELRAVAGKQLDPEVVEALCRVLARRGKSKAEEAEEEETKQSTG